LPDNSEAWPQGIPIHLCKKIYGVHMVLGDQEKFFEALGNHCPENWSSASIP